MSRSRMVTVAGVGVAGLMVCVAAFQVLLAAGVPWGRAAYGGQSADLPPELRISSAVAAVLWLMFAAVILRRAGLVGWAPVPASWVRPLAWVVVALSAAATVLNAITPSPIERAIWLPAAAVMLVGTVVVARS